MSQNLKLFVVGNEVFIETSPVVLAVTKLLGRQWFIDHDVEVRHEKWASANGRVCDYIILRKKAVEWNPEA
jgi:hypothetical protein